MTTSNADSADYADGRGDGVEKRGLLHGEITERIIGAFYSVHSQLGSGFFERVYANGLSVLLRQAGIRVDREVGYEIVFHGEVIGQYRADLIVESKVVVEVKAGRAIDSSHNAQVLNYLKASKLEVGLLLNFGPSAEFKRIVLTRRS
jgi:GxxExxY protein